MSALSPEVRFPEGRPQVQILVTASEAYPELERAFLVAEREIVAGFRVFDLKTRLRSPEGLAVGKTWFDLVIHTLRRGVTLHVVLSDFDPVARPRLHRGTWRLIAPEPIAGEIEAAHQSAVETAGRLIYIETQYFRDRRLARHLAREARRKPGLKLILILPAAPDDVAFEGATGLDARLGEFLQARCLRILRRSFGRRLFVGGAAQPRRTRDRGRAQLNGAPLVYIHAKVSVFDDHLAIVSSANLNGRSLRWDTEAGLILTDPGTVADLRRRLMAHWLPDGAGPDYFDPDRALHVWWALAARNARTAPENRRGFILPYNLREAEAFGRPVPLIPDEMV